MTGEKKREFKLPCKEEPSNSPVEVILNEDGAVFLSDAHTEYMIYLYPSQVKGLLKELRKRKVEK